MTETVVITGASAGIARATARLYGERGANVGLIARGQAGLDGAAHDVEEAGGKALAVSADVADYGQVEDAARQVEDFFGPIDVWINVAFSSVFAPFADVSAEEFRRVTEVSYLGFVHGTMVALHRMRARDRGTIVQVGSALGARSIPLQSAYCGAKHAVNGFTSSLRCELLHEHSGVRVTVVQMPAVNTPQFSWVRSKLPNHPQPVPPIYQPEVAARGVVFAADHPGRKQYWVGASTAWRPSWPTGSCRRCLTAISPAPDLTPSRRRRRPSLAGPTTCGRPLTVPPVTTTVRAASSTTGHTTAARSCGCRSTLAWSPALPPGRRSSAASSRQDWPGPDDRRQVHGVPPGARRLRRCAALRSRRGGPPVQRPAR
jgi:NAD(P)-dependent dehydrogenase (short-subunit alcohol dehydrogenase family)